MWKFLSAATLVALPLLSQDPVNSPKQARELGHVNWERKLEPALAKSAADHKPVLLLFQEVPG